MGYLINCAACGKPHPLYASWCKARNPDIGELDVPEVPFWKATPQHALAGESRRNTFAVPMVRTTEPVHAHDSPDTLTELAVLRARVADLEREREQLVADREAWREQAHRSDVHLQQLTARLPGLPDPADG